MLRFGKTAARSRSGSLCAHTRGLFMQGIALARHVEDSTSGQQDTHNLNLKAALRVRF